MTMRKLVIIGARALGREVCNYAQDIGISVKGFLDSDPSVLNAFSGYPPVLSSVEEYTLENKDVFICALGDSDARKKYVSIIEGKRGEFLSVVHKSAYIGRNVRIGCGCIVAPNVTITADITIGNHVLINVNSSINHDVVLEDFVSIGPGCRLIGRNMLRKGMTLRANTTLFADIGK